MQELLNDIHNIQLEMALEVKRICDKYNIKYSIIAGTLLGAVRHKGFIPWDDDLDIGMLREEYDRFIEVCKKELDDKYFLQTWDTDKDFPLPIAKLRKNGTRYVEKNSSKSNHHKGIYIDIFPFDNVPESTIKRKVQNIVTYILKRMLLIKKNYILWEDNEKLKRIIYKIVFIVSSLFPGYLIKDTLYRVMTMYNDRKTNKVVTFGGAYGYNKETINREWLENNKPIIFENVEFSAPCDYEGYLTYFYGDYMSPPPENKRYNRHNIIEVRFREGS